MYRAAAFEIASFAVPRITGRMILPECVRGAIEYRYGVLGLVSIAHLQMHEAAVGQVAQMPVNRNRIG